jgi:hypothetical protein
MFYKNVVPPPHEDRAAVISQEYPEPAFNILQDVVSPPHEYCAAVISQAYSEPAFNVLQECGATSS